MIQSPQEFDLKEATDRLETSLLTPLVPGELVSWVTMVQDASDDLDELLRPFVESVLHSEYKEIAKADAELLPRVQHLIEDEALVLQQNEEFRRNLQLLMERAPEVHSNEGKVADERLKVEQQGILLLTQLKRLQAAVGTWMSEAMLRDRGAGD